MAPTEEHSDAPGGDRLAIFVASRFVDGVESALDAAFRVTRAGGDGDPLAELHARTARGERFDALFVSLDTQLPAEAIEALAERQVFVSQRMDSLRVTPHLYNDDADIDALFQVLRKRL